MLDQLRIILMDIKLNGLLCIRIILDWLCVGFPPLPSRLMKYLRGMDRMDSGGIHQMHHISQVVTRPTTSISMVDWLKWKDFTECIPKKAGQRFQLWLVVTTPATGIGHHQI